MIIQTQKTLTNAHQAREDYLQALQRLLELGEDKARIEFNKLLLGAQKVLSGTEAGAALDKGWKAWADCAIGYEPPRSIVLCKSCLTVLESKYAHDFQQCECRNGTHVDGGPRGSYRRYGGVDMNLVEIIE